MQSVSSLVHFVGIDVSAGTLDVHVRPSDERFVVLTLPPSSGPGRKFDWTWKGDGYGAEAAHGRRDHREVA